MLTIHRADMQEVILVPRGKGVGTIPLVRQQLPEHSYRRGNLPASNYHNPTLLYKRQRGSIRVATFSRQIRVSLRHIHYYVREVIIIVTPYWKGDCSP
jgi:hypothetical protein